MNATGLTRLFWLVVLVAAVARIYRLDTLSLWADELWGVAACSKGSWWLMVDNLIYQDSHPPGYQTLLYWLLKGLGDSDFMIRLPDALAGIAAVMALYHWGTRHFSPVTGLLAAALLAVSFHSIYYSQEARAYAFVQCFAVVHLYLLFALFLHGRNERRSWWMFWLVGALLAYFHYVGVVILLAEAAVFPWLYRGPAGWRAWCRAFLPILLMYVPWLPVMYRHLFFSDASWATPVPDSQVILGTLKLILGPDMLRVQVSLLMLLAALLLLWRDVRRQAFTLQHRELLAALVIAVLPPVIFFIKSRLGLSAYTMRHFIYIAPVMALWQGWLMSAALQCVRDRLGTRVPLAGTVMLLMIGGTYANIDNHLYVGAFKMEFRQAVDVVAHDEPFMQGPRTVFASHDLFDHYLSRFEVQPHASLVTQRDASDLPRLRETLARTSAQDFYYLEVYFDQQSKADSPLLQALRNTYQATCATPFEWVQVVHFTTAAPEGLQTVLPGCNRQLYPVNRRQSAVGSYPL